MTDSKRTPLLDASDQTEPPPSAQPAEKKPPKRERNELKIEETIRLSDWMRENEFTIQGVGNKKAAARAEEDLGFRITEANVKRLADALNIAVALSVDPTEKKLFAEVRDLRERVATLENVVGDHERWIRRLTDRVEKLESLAIRRGDDYLAVEVDETESISAIGNPTA